MLAIVQRAAKAFVAAIGGGVATYVAAVPDGVTAEEWGKVIGAAIVVGLAAWAVPNKQPAG